MENSKPQELKIEGMTCANCAIGVKKIIEKNGGVNANVNFSTGEANFSTNDHKKLKTISAAINKGGYKVVQKEEKSSKYSKVEKLFAFTCIFTIPLFLHMFFGHDAWINHPITQLLLTLPVLFSGGCFFIKSAISSLKIGVPNMDVLVSTGILAAFVYSTWGIITHWNLPNIHDFLFFETTATVTTLVLLGNVIEHRSIKQTTSAIGDLQKLQATTVKVILEGKIIEKNINEVKVGDFLQINEGDAFPLDGIVETGEFEADESMLSGESEPVFKTNHSKVLGGTLVISGNGSISVTAEKGNSSLDQIIKLVKNAQDSKPEIQKLGDKISAIFVPIVIGIALLTFLVCYFFIDLGIEKSLMQSIAVLVISCPCAMGLAAPTAVMVGVGKAARKGILIKGGQSLEKLAKTETIVFDKTGTLTTGNFSIQKFETHQGTETECKEVLVAMCANSSHPISTSIFSALQQNYNGISLIETNEIKGKGLIALDENNNHFELISSKSFQDSYSKTTDADLLLTKNKELIASLWISDEIKEGVKETISWLITKGITPIMLSGDKEKKCRTVAEQTGISTYYFEKSPSEKLSIMDQLNVKSKTAMLGDGINDAPALAKSYVGISFGIATDAAINSSEVVLLNQKFSTLQEVFTIGNQTYTTIKQNFFWAFAYNVIAIPFAAAGYLKPILAALSMAFSDVIVIGNSILLRFKKSK